MPTYEYACKSCGEHLEVVQSFKDEPLTECPNCGGVLRKVFTPIGINFKGSGFYRTDSRAAAGAREPKKEKPGEKSEKSEKAVGGDSSPDSSSASRRVDSKGGSSSQAKTA
jgi:putative FmdB family regulatory protein